MTLRTLTLAQRRAALRTHCAVQRDELARTVNQIESRLGPLDRGINVVRRYATQPLLIVGAVVLVSAFGPRRLVRWASRSAVFFTAGRRIMRLLR